MSNVAPETGFMDGKLGVRIFYRWQPVVDARAVLIIVHGIFEHVGRYAHVMEHFNGLGYSCLGIDLRGHGQSEGRRVFLNRFEEWVADAELAVDFARERAPALPRFLVGHSGGGLVALHHAMDHSDHVAGYVFSSPGCRNAVKVPRWKDALGKAMSRLVPTLAIPAGIDSSWVSRDPEVVARYVSDPLVTDKATARFYTEFLAGQERALAEADRISRPVLFVVAGADKIIDPQGARDVYERVGSEDKTFEVYPTLYHEIFNEPEKDTVFADVAGWLERQLA